MPNGRGWKLFLAMVVGMLLIGVGVVHSDDASPTWGYIGCSNTLDTVTGYHATFGSQHRFWPTTHLIAGHDLLYEYEIAGGVVSTWANPGDKRWMEFEAMKGQYNGGADPPVVWVQLCARNQELATTTYDTVKTVLANLRSHIGPSARVYISPINTYQPSSLCAMVNESASVTAQWANQAVVDGLALRGPGSRSDNRYALGPLTPDLVYTDWCHPSGPRHKLADGTRQPLEGSGSLLLGVQLSRFFDYVVGP